MKTINPLNRKLLLAIFVAFGFGLAVRGAEATAFELAKEGNRYVGEQSKDRIVQIRCEKSVGGLIPNIWYVVFYDPTATLKAVEVKFGAGKMLDVKRPMRLLEPVTGGEPQRERERAASGREGEEGKRPSDEHGSVHGTFLRNRAAGSAWSGRVPEAISRGRVRSRLPAARAMAATRIPILTRIATP